VTTSRTHERPQKIVVAMYRLAKGTTKALKYEDIVVRAFEMFPEEFALRGHPKYPDSSDIHKPLYGVLKDQGLVHGANKTFALTPRGVEKAKALIEAAGDALEVERSGDRMTRDVRLEIDRMLASPAMRMYDEGKAERIIDTDFFEFVGCSVRTPRHAFLGRVNTTEEAVAVAKKLRQPDPDTAKRLGEVWAFIRKRYESLIPAAKG
jgi:hypothetical protein